METESIVLQSLNIAKNAQIGKFLKCASKDGVVKWDTMPTIGGAALVIQNLTGAELYTIVNSLPPSIEFVNNGQLQLYSRRVGPIINFTASFEINSIAVGANEIEFSINDLDLPSENVPITANLYVAGAIGVFITKLYVSSSNVIIHIKNDEGVPIADSRVTLNGQFSDSSFL